MPRTFLYPGPDLKLPRSGELSMGSRSTVTGDAETRGTRYALLASGEALIASHLAPVGEHADDYVAVAETLLNTPYLWGGATGFGIDCSGLVQLSMRMAGTRRAARFRHAGSDARRADRSRRRIFAACGAATWCSGRAMSRS